jgi:hypothetical protein
MPPKAKIPVPVDRPLSKAYLREFTGWSTAFPPGLSDPTSLRIMENVMVNRDGSLRVRPGLRYLSYDEPPSPEDSVVGTAFGQQIVGTHEVFFLNNGNKAYLFAVREPDETVGFRVLSFTGDDAIVKRLTDPGVDFSIPQTEAVINFSSATTYVKYLQVDNKIFALSDAGEAMRLFYVGGAKLARRILSIERPNWDVPDKLQVIHPDSDWIVGASAETLRLNMLHNPQMVGLTGWTPQGTSTRENSSAQAKSGNTSLLLKSTPTRRNMINEPLHDVASTGKGTWEASNTVHSLNVSGTWLQLTGATGVNPHEAYAHWGGGLIAGIEAGKAYRVAIDFDSFSSSIDPGVFVKWYTSAGAEVGSGTKVFTSSNSAGRHVFGPFTAPAGATKMRVRVGMNIKSTSSHSLKFKNVLVALSTEPTTMFSGASGADYFWTGLPNSSQSIYHPAQDIEVESNKYPVEPGQSILAALEFRGQVPADASIGHRWYDVNGVVLLTAYTTATAVSSSGWTRLHRIDSAPVGATHVALMARFEDVPRDSGRWIDEGLMEARSDLAAYFDGDTPSTTSVVYAWTGNPHESTSAQREYTDSLGIPTAETPTANTLIADPTSDDAYELGIFYNFAFFYTFSNEVGESAASQVTTIKTQRGWSAWRWETSNSLGEPSGNPVADPARAADQLVAIMPEEVFDTAVAQGALRWNLYMLTWSNQTAVPVTGVKVAVRDLTNNPTYESDGWAQVTPQSQNINEEAAVPHISNRYNYSDPSKGGQGLVAADRMVVVHDPTAAAVIRWSSNEQGDYTNFTAGRGGGYKTLTSGELMIPAAVKLWQNPESKDTITILCRGIDGHNTAYYMAPASVSAQSDTVQIMAFEETTATPGTTSPYGCEVLNNALYHPLDEQLMKSTASNYNISHKSVTEQIENRWIGLQHKDKIVSSQLDSRIYLIVHNPRGDQLEEGCNGNELWVFDAAAENGHWSRWKIQALSLRKIEQGGRVYMSVVRPDGIYYLDPLYDRDDYVADDLTVQQRFIPWRMETNTQGANRAHDAWCRLQQLQLTVGSFQGRMRWGIRSWDVNGKPVEKSKIIRDDNAPDDIDSLPYDYEDVLLVRKDLKEWLLFAESITEDDEVVKSYGQINHVQYRYAPVSVNVGYEYGSVETFEYGRDVALAASNTANGIPVPALDARRP